MSSFVVNEYALGKASQRAVLFQQFFQKQGRITKFHLNCSDSSEGRAELHHIAPLELATRLRSVWDNVGIECVPNNFHPGDIAMVVKFVQELQ